MSFVYAISGAFIAAIAATNVPGMADGNTLSFVAFAFCAFLAVYHLAMAIRTWDKP